LDTWLTAAAIFVVRPILFYSQFFTNPYGSWDTHHSLLSPDRKDIIGGLTYWQAQHTVRRGDQPWFYYLLTLSLYEQLALLFGIGGVILSFFQRSFFRTFLVWWAVLAYGLFTWAGEKMPWLSLHIALPFILLAGYSLNGVVRSQRPRLLLAVGALFALLLALEVHSMVALSFEDPANPTEMLIYVQTSQDVPNTVHEIGQIAARTKLGYNLPIGLDNTDVGGWPFIWYLRDYKNVSETAAFGSPACNGQLCAALIMLEPQYTANSAFLSKHYVVQKYRWNWWFPEDYKTWFPAHWNALLDDLQRALDYFETHPISRKMGPEEGRSYNHDAAKPPPPAPHVPKNRKDAIRGQVILPREVGFAEASHVYNELFDGVHPSAIARPVNASDVAAGARPERHVAGDRPDRRLQRGDPARHEGPGHQPPQPGVVGRVDVEHVS